MTKVLISYAWEDNLHKEWVRTLADRLLDNGIDVILDQYDLLPGDRLQPFMEKGVNNADYVLIICTPTYKEKYEDRKGGVGYEGNLISEELYSLGDERKFIPILRKGEKEEALPIGLAGKNYIDLRDGEYYEINFEILIATLQGISPKPPINQNTSLSKNGKEKSDIRVISEQDLIVEEPIRILGIITDQVTVPRMDGTRGSALYKIPFRLSKKPSDLWKKLFLQAWQSPPSFSTMHRPGIASIQGDQIILDGTTVEEVRDYHRETLMLCVDIANKKEKDILEAEQTKKELEEARKRKHLENVNDVAGSIKF